MDAPEPKLLEPELKRHYLSGKKCGDDAVSVPRTVLPAVLPSLLPDNRRRPSRRTGTLVPP